MPRRSEHSRDQIRHMAIDAAERIIAADGADALSARRITRDIGYSVGSLYLVFDNLDHVIAHLNRRTLTYLYQAMSAAGDGRAKSLTRLKRMGRAYAGYSKDNPHLLRLAFEHPSLAVPPSDQDRNSRALIDLMLGSLGEATGLSGQRLETTAQVLWASVHGICILTLTNKMLQIGRTRKIETLTDTLIENYIGGVNAGR